MKALETLDDKKVGVYLRKESEYENITTGYGSLQWLKYELEEHEGGLEIYIDRKNEALNLYELFDDIEDEFIEAVLLWSIRDVEPSWVNMLTHLCDEKEIPIVSFCETGESLNETIKTTIEHIRMLNTNLGYF